MFNIGLLIHSKDDATAEVTRFRVTLLKIDAAAGENCIVKDELYQLTVQPNSQSSCRSSPPVLPPAKIFTLKDPSPIEGKNNQFTAVVGYLP